MKERARNSMNELRNRKSFPTEYCLFSIAITSKGERGEKWKFPLYLEKKEKRKGEFDRLRKSFLDFLKKVKSVKLIRMKRISKDRDFKKESKCASLHCVFSIFLCC